MGFQKYDSLENAYRQKFVGAYFTPGIKEAGTVVDIPTKAR